MRSTKDLKEIVSGSRAKSKLNGIAGKDYAGQGTPIGDGEVTTAADDDEAAPFDKKRVQKKTSGNGNDWEAKFKGQGGSDKGGSS